MRTIHAALAILALLVGPSGQSFDVIVHPDNEETSVTRHELSRIFLKRLRTWKGGASAVPIDQGPDSQTRKDFTRRVHRRSVVNIEVHWKRMIFSGRAVPPSEVGDDAAVVEFVRRTPGAVGYVAAGTRLDGVRRLEVTD